MFRKFGLYIFSLIQIITFLAYSNNVYAATPPTVTANSAIVMDAETGQILFEKNANEKNYPASITKLMTALLAVENLNKEDTITFSLNAVYSIEYGSSHIGIRENEVLTVDQALHGLLLMSANEVANGIAEKVSGTMEAFAVKMTERAKELGALNTNFANPSGLHDDNHYTTAYDMALITKEAIKNPYFMEIMGHTTYEIPPTNIVTEVRYLAQQHKMLNEKKDANIYREDVIAGKTGYTVNAGHTLVTVARQGNRTLIVVLMQSTADTMYPDTSTLIDYGFDNFKNVTLDQTVYQNTLQIVEDGTAIGEAKLSITPFEVVMPVSAEQNLLTYNADIPTELTKTYAIGDVVGTLSVEYMGKKLRTVDITVQSIDIQEQEITAYQDTVPTEKSKPPVVLIILLILLLSILAFFIYQLKTNKGGHYSRYVQKHRRL